MKTLDRITVCSHDRRSDLGAGELKLGRDYVCIYIPALAETVLPNWDVRGHSIIAAAGGAVRYTGEIVGVSVHGTARQSRTTLRCEPAEPHGE